MSVDSPISEAPSAVGLDPTPLSSTLTAQTEGGSSQAQAQTLREADAPKADTGPRRCIYCIIDCDHETRFGPIGIDQASPEVFTIPYEGLAVAVSATHLDKFDISRGNVLAHQRVMETMMQRGHTVLPVKFNTIAEDKAGRSAESRIMEQVLVGRMSELSALLATMSTRVELGVKALWPDMDAVFRRIVSDHPKIKSLRGRLLAATRGGSARPRSNLLAAHARLGEMVKNALEARKGDAEKALTSRLAGIAADVRKNKTFGDAMFANLALLVEKTRQEEISLALSAFEAEQGEQVKLRCVGPVPPSNFIELVIGWDD